jgi:hypothetical protein
MLQAALIQTLLTLTGHERPAFAAMHGLTCYT